MSASPPIDESAPIVEEAPTGTSVSSAEEVTTPGTDSETASAAGILPSVAPSKGPRPAVGDLLTQLEKTAVKTSRARTLAFVAGICGATVLVPTFYLLVTGNLSHVRERFLASELSPSHDARVVGIANGTNGDKSDSLSKTLPRRAQPRPAMDAVALDLDLYLSRDIPALTQLEKQAILDYASTTGANYKSDAESIRVIHDKVVPEYNAYVDRAAAVKPLTPEVRALHGEFLNMIRAKRDAFTAMGNANKSSGDWKTRVKFSMLESLQAKDRYAKMATDLAERHHVHITIHKQAE